MCFAEREDSTVVDGHVASSIRRCARSAWVHLANAGNAPPKWRSAGTAVVRSYHEEMYRRFPYLQCCDDDWKVEQIAMDNYPSWYSSWVKKKKATGEDTCIKDEPEPSTTSVKCPNDATSDLATKKMRTTSQPAAANANNNTPLGSVTISGLDFPVWNLFHDLAYQHSA